MNGVAFLARFFYAQVQEGARCFLQVVGEVFRAHGGGGKGDDGALAPGRLKGPCHDFRGLFVVNKGNVALDDFHGATAVVGLGGGGGHVGEAAAQGIAVGHRVGANGAFQDHLIGNDVVFVAAVSGADGNDRRSKGGNVAGHNALQGHDDVAAADNGVHTALGIGRVAALAP